MSHLSSSQRQTHRNGVMFIAGKWGLSPAIALSGTRLSYHYLRADVISPQWLSSLTTVAEPASRYYLRKPAINTRLYLTACFESCSVFL